MNLHIVKNKNQSYPSLLLFTSLPVIYNFSIEFYITIVYNIIIVICALFTIIFKLLEDCKNMKTKNKPYPYYNVPEISDLKELVDYCANNYADRVSFHWLEKKIEITKTYKEFKEDVEALGTYFISKGYNKAHIAIMGENCYELILTYFAVINSGNIIVPFAKDSAPDDLEYLYKHSDSSVIVCTDAYFNAAQALNCETTINTKNLYDCIDAGKKLIASGDNSYKNLAIDKDALSVLVYTSGTTSRPKGVMLSHGCIAFYITATLKNLQFPDSAFLLVPLHHIYAFASVIVGSMFNGASVFINSSLKNLLSDIQFSKPKFIPCVPLVVEMFNKSIKDNIKKSGKENAVKTLVKISNALLSIGIDVRRKFFKNIIDAFGGNLEILAVGGAPLNEQLVIDFNNYGIKVVNGYGTTELADVSMMRNEHFEPRSVGSINPGIEVRIVDGEIQLKKGPALFLGYYKDEETTNKSFDGEWYKTGDIGRMENNFLYITGRLKNLIVLPNGENVSPEELELKLSCAIPQISEIIVSEKNGIIVAEIFSKDADDATRNNIKNLVFEHNKNLPTFKHIGEVVFRDVGFPRTTTNKIKRT